MKNNSFDEEIQYFKNKIQMAFENIDGSWDFCPLKIIFSLDSPINLTWPWMFFDSLVGHLRLVDLLGNDYFLLPRKFPLGRVLRDLNPPSLPIKKTDGLYHSSISFFDNEDEHMEVLYKKFESRWCKKNRKIRKGSGFFKDYAMKHVYLAASRVCFFVCGDKSELARYCRMVNGLGNDTRVGWGSVKSFSIVHIKKDFSVVKDGVAMRPVPRGLCTPVNKDSLVSLAWRPPYWASENVDRCIPPGGRVLDYG